LSLTAIFYELGLLFYKGDLVSGEINIAIASMTMTSERAEVVDFVAPYFDQSGISIITRFPVKPKSLFKFVDGTDFLR
jgi:ionotropic glutamate receptor